MHAHKVGELWIHREPRSLAAVGITKCLARPGPPGLSIADTCDIFARRRQRPSALWGALRVWTVFRDEWRREDVSSVERVSSGHSTVTHSHYPLAIQLGALMGILDNRMNGDHEQCAGRTCSCINKSASRRTAE